MEELESLFGQPQFGQSGFDFGGDFKNQGPELGFCSLQLVFGFGDLPGLEVPEWDIQGQANTRVCPIELPVAEARELEIVKSLPF